MPGAIDPTLDRSRLPQHVGIVMAGHTRWAEEHGVSVGRSRIEGLRAAWRTILAAREMGIPFLSLYPHRSDEADAIRTREGALLRLAAERLASEAATCRNLGIRIVHSGTAPQGAETAVRLLKEAEGTTRSGANGLTVNIALGASGRSEIVRAVNRWLAERRESHGVAADGAITDEVLREHLDLPDFPEADLIVRSGGEQRVSNFLLWESAYAEFVFSDTLWPDWGAKDLTEAVGEYQRRSRRFGGTS